MLGRGLQQVAARQHVVAQVAPGPLHAFADEGVGGEVQDAIKALAAEELAQRLGLQQVAVDEARSGMHGRAVTVDEVVADGDLVAARDQQIGHVAADVACAAGHQQLHGRSPSVCVGAGVRLEVVYNRMVKAVERVFRVLAQLDFFVAIVK